MDTETLAVYGLQALLWFAALYRRGARPCIVVIGIALVGSWLIGEAFTGNDRDAANMVFSLAIVLAMQEYHADAHQRLVALLAVVSIGIRLSHVTVRYTDHYTYAVALNCVVLLQLFIAGGWIDQWGNRIDHWLDRLHPRLARALRYVAT